LRDVRQARARKDAAERELVVAMVAAHESGETFRDIGEEAGLSHQRVHELVRSEQRRRDQEG
jgi:hypothetical protein